VGTDGFCVITRAICDLWEIAACSIATVSATTILRVWGLVLYMVTAKTKVTTESSINRIKAWQ